MRRFLLLALPLLALVALQGCASRAESTAPPSSPQDRAQSEEAARKGAERLRLEGQAEAARTMTPSTR